MSELSAGEGLLQRHAAQLADWWVLRPALKAHLIESCITDIPEPPAAEAQQALRQFWRQRRLAPRQRQAWLQQQGLTPAELQVRLCRNLRWQSWCQQRWGHRLEALFLKHKHRLDRVSARVLQLEDRGLAQELYLQLQEQEGSFEELQALYCQGQPGRHGIRIGPAAPLGSLRGPMAQLLRSTPVGPWREPQPLQHGWAVVQVEDLLSQRLDDPAVRQRLPILEGEAWLAARVQQQLTRLRAEPGPAPA